MMKKNLSPLVLALAIFITGCSGNFNSHSAADHSAHKTSPAGKHDDHEHRAETTKVQLDHGQKWHANAETTAGIEKMLTSVDRQLNAANPDIKALQQNLDQEFNRILQKCTMTGEAHTQLHNYLLPLKDKLDKLPAQSDKATLSDIKAYLKTYNDYFQ